MKIVLMLLCCITLVSCSLFENAPEERINHAVFCWLKDSGNKVQRAQVIAISETFREIPGVLEVRVGEVIPSDRAIVESGYDVAIFLSFHNKEDLKAYLDHEIHQDAKKTVLIPLTKKVIVYDFVEKFKSYKQSFLKLKYKKAQLVMSWAFL